MIGNKDCYIIDKLLLVSELSWKNMAHLSYYMIGVIFNDRNRLL
jgi:hypothetical protein